MKEQLKELYKELFVIYNSFSDEQHQSVFSSMVGKRYMGNDVRMMLVGRAVNGWPEEYDFSSAEEFSNCAMGYMNDSSRWEWVENNNGRLTAKGNSEYSLERSRFWNYSRDIFKQLTNEPEDDSRIWMDNILWSNLYRLSPENGNPGGRSQKKQKEVCLKILNAEVEYFKPTHILFVTGYDWMFEDIRKKLTKISGKYVEAVGNLSGAKAVIVKRPERVGKEGYVKECIEAFRK